MKMRNQIRPALVMLIFFTLITGLLYPMLITGLAQVFFPSQANGSLIKRNGQIIGSDLIGQQFDQPQYFWGRPSATSDIPYNASASGGSNDSVLNPDLQANVEARLLALHTANPENIMPVPVDLVTASASGLDPHISVASAQYQAARIAKARGLSVAQILTLIEKSTHDRIFGILGEKTVNVLEVNIALDEIQ
jgi:K+-transporting ATPase ATPase C chain